MLNYKVQLITLNEPITAVSHSSGCWELIREGELLMMFSSWCDDYDRHHLTLLHDCDVYTTCLYESAFKVLEAPR